MFAVGSHKGPPSRRRGRPVGGAAVLTWTLMTAAGALVLAACGSATPSRSASGASASNAAASGSAASTAAGQGAASSVAACKNVSAPAPRPGEHEPQPTLRLDPTKTYTVTLATNCGAIQVALDVERAPKTAASFASLVSRGFYDGLTFHRIVPGFVIQGGDPNGNGTGGPGYHVVEAPPRDLQYTRGVVAMAKTADEPSGSSGSQFFIVTAANAGLPPDYALVGHVVGSEQAVDAISKAATEGPDAEDSTPRIPIVIDRATLASS